MTSHAVSISISLSISLTISILLAFGSRYADAAPDWTMTFSAEAVVAGGSAVYLSPDDKELCVPSVVRLKISAEQPARFYVFRVHVASKPLTFVYAGESSERELKTEYTVLDYEDAPPADGIYIVAAERAMEPGALRDSARRYGPLRLSPHSTAPVARTDTPFLVWKGNDAMKGPKPVKARSKDGVAVALFKFRRSSACELR